MIFDTDRVRSLFAATAPIWITFLTRVSKASREAELLNFDLMRDHNKIIRPVPHNTGILNVSLGLVFMQLLGVDEVNQVITTSMIVRQTWNDYKLRWNPEKYANITHIDVPAESIWLPDIVLYNNADGNYQITIFTKARIYYTGDVVWEPPAIYKSYCMIDVKYFPYDEQSCDMKFGSWTFDGMSVNLMHIRGYVADDKKIVVGMDMSMYKKSIEWDILEASAQRHTNFYACCREPYLDITYTLVVRRKTKFYTVNLICPCVAISFLTVFVFYLPSDSGEKVTLCISILLSLTVFFLLLTKIIPPTSLTIPLIGKYLLFTMIMVVLSIVITIFILNIHFRSPATHVMRPWVRVVFLEFLPKVLMIKRPSKYPGNIRQKNGLLYHQVKPDNVELRHVARRHQDPRWSERTELDPDRKVNVLQQTDVQNVIRGINYISDHVREESSVRLVIHDWKFIALVLDRLFLLIFAAATICGFAGIILDAPSLYENRGVIPIKCETAPESGTDREWLCLFEADEN